MAPFDDLDKVAGAGRQIGRQVRDRFLATGSPAGAKERGKELVKEYLAQGGIFDYQRRRSEYGKDGFTQLRQFRSISKQYAESKHT